MAKRLGQDYFQLAMVVVRSDDTSLVSNPF